MSPIDFSTTLKCPKTFTSITIRSSLSITVPAGCQIQLQSHYIQPDLATTDSDLETVHYKWTRDSSVLFPTNHKEAFQATVEHLQNLSTVSVDAAMASAIANNNHDNKTVHDNLKDLEQIINKTPDHLHQRIMCS